MKKTFKSAALYRGATFDLERTDDNIENFIDIENRMVTMSFASTEPVEREFGNEVLEITEEAMDLDRLRAAAPFLVNHDRMDQVGVIESVWVSDGKSYAQVKFSQSLRASEIFQDVIDGIRRTVSFGYRINEIEKQADKRNKNGLETYIVKRYQPFEISLETIPADYSVGVGRNSDEDFETEVTIIDNEIREDKIPAITVKDNKMADNKEFETGMKAERKRLNAIRKMADGVRHLLPKIDELKNEFEDSDRSVEEFNEAILTRMNSVKLEVVEQRQDMNLELSPKEVQTFSLMRLADALSTGNWKDAGFEAEVSRAQADLNGTDPRGAFIPLNVLAQRADSNPATSVAGVAGSLIATDYYGSQYIDVLRANSVVVAAGAMVLPGLVGDVDIPKAANEATFSWLAEDDANDSTQYSATTVALTPQDIGGALGYTRKMQKQTGNPAIENLMRDSLNAGIGVFLDKQALVGTQAGASGITSVAGTINDSGTTAAYSAVSWDHILELEAAIAANNAEQGALGWVTSPAVRGYLKGTIKDSSGAAGFLMNTDGLVNGQKCLVTSHAGAGNLFYGNWNDLLIPMWGGVDIVVDTATNVAKGGVVIRAFLATDIAIRRSESFAVQSGIAL